MNEQWFYASGGQQIGPVGLDDLRRLIVRGLVKAEDLVWKTGLDSWVPAVSRSELFRPTSSVAAMAQPALRPGAQPGVSSDAYTLMRFEANKKSILVAYLLWWFTGLFGGHRFYLGRTNSALIKLVMTVVSIPLCFVGIGVLGLMASAIWSLVDAFLIPEICRSFNLELASELSGGRPDPRRMNLAQSVAV